MKEENKKKFVLFILRCEIEMFFLQIEFAMPLRIDADIKKALITESYWKTLN